MTIAQTGDLDLVPQVDLRGPFRMGLLGLALMGGALGGWAASTQIGGAVVTSGQVVATGRPQLVQSLDPGIVREIAVRDGDRVAAGDVLLRLDRTLVETNLGIARARLADALAIRARLEAEQDGRDAPAFRYDALPFTAPDTARQEEAQRRIFAARAEVLAGGRAQLAETLGQFDARLAGLAAQVESKRAQAALIEEDLADLRTLEAEGLVRASDLNEKIRHASEAHGQVAALEAEAAELAIAMLDAEIATEQEERAFRETVASDLQEAQAGVDELVLEIVTREAELERTEVRSPADGIVHEMQVTTVGGVVPAGETLLEVMPTGEGIEFELRVDPRAIDQVHPGQPAEVVVAPLDPAATPRLLAEVATVPAAAVVDPQTGASFYRVTLAVSPAEIARLGEDVALIPGMPVDAFLQTGDRSVLAYLLHPVSSQMRRAFRES